MQPFHFGPEGQRLFGVYHAPGATQAASAGAVLCYPVLQEYFRSHRAFLRLAALLAARGWHVLRFDYSGCGDSYGDGPRDPGAWRQDLRIAVRELRERSGAGRLALVGLRAGASLAASAAESVQPLSDLVLWDPVVDGREYARDLDAFRHSATLRASHRQQMARLSPNDRGVGLEITPDVMQLLGSLDREEQLNARARRILVLDSQASDATADFARRLGEGRSGVTFNRLSEGPVWGERKKHSPHNVVVPTASLQAIVNWMSAADA
jgi:alpha/beta superfamily hydrolase